jgi:hypothetical protein
LTAPANRYFRRSAAAHYVRETWGMPCSAKWLAKLAVIGGGPIYRKAGRFPLYTKDDLDHWVGTRLGAPRRSTSVEAWCDDGDTSPEP